MIALDSLQTGVTSKVVYGNRSDNHCKQSGAWPSATSTAVLASAQLPFPPFLLERTCMHAYTYVHTHTFTLTHNMHSALSHCVAF